MTNGTEKSLGAVHKPDLINWTCSWKLKLSLKSALWLVNKRRKKIYLKNYEIAFKIFYEEYESTYLSIRYIYFKLKLVLKLENITYSVTIVYNCFYLY